jgi:CubicO group peptidase (beta-lactamase class C family)
MATKPNQRSLFRATCVAFATLLLVSHGTPATAAGEAERARQWIESKVPEMMREAKMPGFAIAVVSDGETLYAGGFGARDPATGLPATADTLFGIGSVTKSFVAIAVLQLADQGKLSLDDPASDYIPLELGRPGEPITIRHLLTHSPGFPNLGTSTVLISRGLGRNTGVPMTSAADFYRFVNAARDEVAFAPGERFFYNNSAWRMLGHVVQEVSGMPFHRYLEERVIRPLGMERTTLDTDALFSDPDHLTPHRNGEDGPEPAAFPYPNPDLNPGFSFLAAAGGISSSVREMTRYVNALIDEGRYGDNTLIAREAAAEMQSLQIRTGQSYHGDIGYGFGLSITPDFLGHKLVSHGGSISVSTAHMAFVPQHRIGVVMMGNSSGMSYGSIAESVLAILMGHDPESLPGRDVDARMKQLVGHYETYRGLASTEVFERRGMLWVGSESSARPLIPEDPTYESTRFYFLSGSLRQPVEFISQDDGTTLLVIDRYTYHRQH